MRTKCCHLYGNPGLRGKLPLSSGGSRNFTCGGNGVACSIDRVACVSIASLFLNFDISKAELENVFMITALLYKYYKLHRLLLLT